MKFLSSVLALAMASSAFAAIQDPCNGAGYEPGYNVDPDGPGPMDGWKVTWDDDMRDRMVSYACHSCTTCTQAGLPPFKEKCDYPNGFRSARVAMDNEPPFCLTVGDASKSMVQVLIETEEDDDHLCVESIGSKIALNNGVTVPAQCGEGQINACFPGEDDGTLELIVYCDSSCPETPINFHYKVLHSASRTLFNNNPTMQANSAVDNIDMWCMMQDGVPAVMWPSEMEPDEPDDLHRSARLYNGAGVASSSMAMVTALAASVFAFAR